jgi:hypothetical protein
MWQFLLLYLVVALCGDMVINLNNIFIYGIPLRDLWPYYVVALVIETVFGVLVFEAFTLIRLRKVRRYFLSGFDEASQALVWQRLIRFPTEMFWTMVCFGLAASFLFHFFDPSLRGEQLPQLISDVLQPVFFEQTLSLILAIMFYILIRRLLRPTVVLRTSCAALHSKGMLSSGLPSPHWLCGDLKPQCRPCKLLLTIRVQERLIELKPRGISA